MHGQNHIKYRVLLLTIFVFVLVTKDSDLMTLHNKLGNFRRA